MTGAAGALDAPRYLLRLFVTGQTGRSVRAVDNIRRLCERHLKDRYDLEVIDIYQQPELAARHQLIAAPTLVKEEPLPARRLVGDMSDNARVLSGLGLAAA